MKTNTSWETIKETLRRAAARPHVPPAEEFWREFQARVPPRRTEVITRVSVWVPAWRWATVGLATSLLVVLGLLLPGLKKRGTQELSEVLALKVVASHSALLIMHDVNTKSTLVWVEGFGEKSGSGEAL